MYTRRSNEYFGQYFGCVAVSDLGAGGTDLIPGTSTTLIRNRIPLIELELKLTLTQSKMSLE